jgi:type IV pilus assembly protein PilM
LFLSKKKPPLIGLDISSTSVKVMELSKNASGYRIEGIAVEPLPANAIVDKNIAEIEIVAESVKRALHKSKIKNKQVAIAVAGSSVITKKITMPISLSEDEMEGQILLEADQYIPYPLEEVNLDFSGFGADQR